MLPAELAAPPAWKLFTRLGESLILMPAALLVLSSLLREVAGRVLVWRWLLGLTAAVAVVTASKLAFIGWGLGSAAIDFTGFSGHAMFAAAVHPLLFGALLPALMPTRGPAAVRAAVTAGLLLAAMVGVSRVVVGAHSWSEVITGLALGGLVGAQAYRLAPLHAGNDPSGYNGRSPALWRRSAWMLPLVVLWLLTVSLLAPPSPTHSMVTRLALRLSGHSQPYTREWLHSHPRAGLRLQSSPAPTGAVAAAGAAPSAVVTGPLPL